jgi:hypothetical protein
MEWSCSFNMVHSDHIRQFVGGNFWSRLSLPVLNMLVFEGLNFGLSFNIVHCVLVMFTLMEQGRN